MSRIGYTIRELKDAGVCGPTKAYDLIAQGKLEKVKIGRKTIITARSVDRLLEAVAA